MLGVIVAVGCCAVAAGLLIGAGWLALELGKALIIWEAIAQARHDNGEETEKCRQGKCRYC